MIRKREKIRQQTNALEASAIKRNKSLLDARRRLDRQRTQYKKLEQTEEQESEILLSKLMAFASEKTDATAPNDASNTATVTTGNQANNETNEKLVDQDKSRSGIHDLENFLEILEKNREDSLAREFKTNIDYSMLPKMISQKAETLQKETEKIRAEITRLEAMHRGAENPRIENGVGESNPDGSPTA